MPAIAPAFLLAIFGVGLVYFGALDWLKVRLFAQLKLR
jgi:hypothetical protein